MSHHLPFDRVELIKVFEKCNAGVLVSFVNHLAQEGIKSNDVFLSMSDKTSEQTVMGAKAVKVGRMPSSEGWKSCTLGFATRGEMVFVIGLGHEERGRKLRRPA